MDIDATRLNRRTVLEKHDLEEGSMVGRERWEELRRLHDVDGLTVSQIARQVDMDRKTVRKWLGRKQWDPYQRKAKENTLLAEHAHYLRERAPVGVKVVAA